MTGCPSTVANITFTVQDGCCSTSAGSIKLSIDTDITIIIIPSPTATYNFYFDSPLATESHTMPRVLECPAWRQISTGRILLRGTSGSCFFFPKIFHLRRGIQIPLRFTLTRSLLKPRCVFVSELPLMHCNALFHQFHLKIFHAAWCGWLLIPPPFP